MPEIQGKSTSLGKVMLLCRRREDSASKSETLGDFPQAKRSQKQF